MPQQRAGQLRRLHRSEGTAQRDGDLPSLPTAARLGGRTRVRQFRGQPRPGVPTVPPGRTGDAQPTDCSGIAAGPNHDLCEWSNALKGASEQRSGANAGGMEGARGCVTQLQAPNPALGVCTAGVYQVAVAWQGMVATATPALACGTGLYGASDGFRRTIAATVSVGTTSCY